MDLRPATSEWVSDFAVTPITRCVSILTRFSLGPSGPVKLAKKDAKPAAKPAAKVCFYCFQAHMLSLLILFQKETKDVKPKATATKKAAPKKPKAAAAKKASTTKKTTTKANTAKPRAKKTKAAAPVGVTTPPCPN